MKSPTFESFNEKWAQRMVGRVANKGIDGYLQLKVVEIKPGWLVCEMPVSDEILANTGNVHTGCLSVLCDHVLGTIMYPVMPTGHWATTTEYKINLVAPVTTGLCLARGQIMAMTERSATVQIQVENEDKLVAMAQGTCAIVPPAPRPMPT